MFSGFDAETKEDSLPLNYATYGYNIATRNGVLTDSVGVEATDYDGSIFPDATKDDMEIEKLYYFKHFSYHYGVKNDRIIALRENKVYQSEIDGSEFREILGMEFISPNVKFFNYYSDNNDYLVAVTDAGEMKLFDGITVTNVENCPALSDACVHFGRIYGIVDKSSRVYFSALLDPTNWTNSLTGGGYITMTDDGGLVKRIVSFKDNLYIFREYAIYKLTAFGDQTDFVLSKIYTGDNKICPDTVTVCNDRILFLADDGFYSFDGYTIKKVLRNIFPLIVDTRYATACFFNHKYYLSVKIKTDDNKVGDEIFVNYAMKNNGMIIYDVDMGEVSIFRGADIRGFMPISTQNINKLFVCFNNIPRFYSIGVITETGRLFGGELLKKWVSPVTNFETLSKDKVLKRLYISSNSDLTLITRLDTDAKFYLSSAYKAQMIPVNRRADKLGLVIETTSDNFAVTGMLLEFDLIRRRTDE
jgi:hypothetical protein